MATFHIKEDDDAPTISTTLKDSAGTVINLTGATVTIRAKRIGSTTRVIDGKSVTVSSATGGVVQYQLDTTETATHGVYRLEWDVTYSGGRVETFPNEGYDIMQIEKVL
jgi:hypothetical protein